MKEELLFLAGVGFAFVANRFRRPKYTMEQVDVGCEHYDQGPLSPEERLNADRVWAYYLVICKIVGERLRIRGWRRREECNDARDGADGSKHQRAGAIDTDPTRAQTTLVRRKLYELGDIPSVDWRGKIQRRTRWGDLIRREIGADVGVGLILYSGGGLHVDVGCAPEAGAPCGLRRNDYLDLNAP